MNKSIFILLLTASLYMHAAQTESKPKDKKNKDRKEATLYIMRNIFNGSKAVIGSLYCLSSLEKTFYDKYASISHRGWNLSQTLLSAGIAYHGIQQLSKLLEFNSVKEMMAYLNTVDTQS
jgi:hypothetical protein